jgi:hypothetical protein
MMTEHVNPMGKESRRDHFSFFGREPLAIKGKGNITPFRN